MKFEIFYLPKLNVLICRGFYSFYMETAPNIYASIKFSPVFKLNSFAHQWHLRDKCGNTEWSIRRNKVDV